MVDWLVDLLVGWLVGWLIGLLVGLLVRWLVGWLVGVEGFSLLVLGLRSSIKTTLCGAVSIVFRLFAWRGGLAWKWCAVYQVTEVGVSYEWPHNVVLRFLVRGVPLRKRRNASRRRRVNQFEVLIQDRPQQKQKQIKKTLRPGPGIKSNSPGHQNLGSNRRMQGE